MKENDYIPKRILYLDFDQVLLATEDVLFIEYNEKKKQGIYLDKQKYLEDFDWHWLVFNSEVIANSLEVLRTIPEAKILTKIHSLEEASAKIKFLRAQELPNEIILVPGNHQKIDLVQAKDNILVDDAVHNLDAWTSAGGISYFFNKDNNDIDSWGRANTKYPKIRTLNMFKK